MTMPHQAWTPEGFERYRDLYPHTPALNPEPDPIWTMRFTDAWRSGLRGVESALRARAADTTVVFMRGYLGRYMPHNLSAPCSALRRLGFDAFIARHRSGGTVEHNVAAVAAQLQRRRLRERIVFCGHSRGGLESLRLLASHPWIAKRCDGVALSQTPHGPSFVMDSVLAGLHRERRFSMRRRVAETLQRLSLTLIGARPGGRELTSAVWPAVVATVDRRRWPFRVVQTASWSSQPTAWLDSFHGRLGEIGPGRAHDGQFFLDDLVWPGLPHVLLPHLDHAQPAVGGLGFDHARYWLSILTVVTT
jgi:pimeloyl-ACP methyl ester carboxylesterase